METKHSFVGMFAVAMQTVMGSGIWFHELKVKSKDIYDQNGNVDFIHNITR